MAATVGEFNRRLEIAAGALSTTESPIVLADTNGEFVAVEHTWDGTHPNAQEELRIAAAFADALAREFSIGALYSWPFPNVPEVPVELKLRHPDSPED